MDKKPIEILAEVCEVTIEAIKKYEDRPYVSVPVINALEAMKIAMKQAWDAGYNAGNITTLRNNTDQIGNYEWNRTITDFDDYLKGLEETK